MSTFWNVSNPKKPRGEKDPNAVLPYPIDFSDWLERLGEAYVSHTILTSDGLTVVSSAHNAGIINVELSGGVVDTTEWFTVRVATASYTDDRTFYLKIVER